MSTEDGYPRQFHYVGGFIQLFGDPESPFGIIDDGHLAQRIAEAIAYGIPRELGINEVQVDFTEAALAIDFLEASENGDS